MSTRTILSRLLEALILAALAGGIGYALTTWLAPPSVSAKLVAAVVASIVVLGVLAPAAIINALGQRNNSAYIDRSDTYCDLRVYLTNEEGWKE